LTKRILSREQQQLLSQVMQLFQEFFYWWRFDPADYLPILYSDRAQQARQICGENTCLMTFKT